LVYNDDNNEWKLELFSKGYHSRNRTEFAYKREAGCPRFLKELINPAMSQEDAKLLQYYMGQCILAHNHDQSFLLMTGTPGGGKSTTVNILECIIGDFNVTELRLEHMNSRFELQRLIGKTLLTSKDVRSNFLNTSGASKLKSLVGNDPLTTETKGQNNVSKIRGNFNVIITANNNLKVTLDGDLEAWRRRMLWIKYDREPPEEVITDFDIQLLESEGSGILNWALEGAAKLMKEKGKEKGEKKGKGKIPRSPEQKKRINNLLEESDAVNVFVKECIESATGESITSNEILLAFNDYCKQRGWGLLQVNAFRQALRGAMLNHHNTNKRNDIMREGKEHRGYSGVKLVPFKAD
jgi:P4 family phage/plasmid primase-like protien